MVTEKNEVSVTEEATSANHLLLKELLKWVNGCILLRETRESSM